MSSIESLERNIEVAERISLDLWGRGDLSVLDDCYAEDCVVHTGGQTFRGRDAFRAYLEEMADGISGIEVSVDDVFGSGDRVATRYSFSGTHDAEMMGIPPTGNSFESGGINICRFEDGLVVEEWDQGDTFGLMQQLGVIPEQSR